MKKNTEFSIIIPVYNVEKYLKKCLESIVNQTYKNFEAICINDGSTDNSLEILNTYSKNDSRIKIFSQPNQGQGIARNKALQAACGNYILFVDPDDRLELNTLEILYNEFLKEQVDVILFDYETYCEETNKRHIKSFYKDIQKRLHTKISENKTYKWNEIKNRDLISIPMSVWNKAYRADFIKEHKIKFSPNKHGEDRIFSISAMLMANKFSYIKQSLYHYNHRAGSAVNKASDDNFCVFDNIKILKDFLISNNLFDSYNKEYENYLIDLLSCHYSNIPQKSIDRYLDKCKEILSSKDFKTLQKKCNGKFSYIENIFSIKNRRIYGERRKVMKILGMEFCLRAKSENGGICAGI